VAFGDGALVEPGSRGWYYDDSSAEAELACGENGPLVRLTEGLALPETDSIPVIACNLVITTLEVAAPALDLGDGALDISAASCLGASSESAAGVGDACSPAIEPPQGYAPREAYIQTGASECETGTCMAYQVGSASSTLGPSGIYCTCRCDAPEGGGCECPNGFSCVTVATDVAPHLDGGYCVRRPNGSGSPRVEVGPAPDASAP
jgi:hypothetical protein